MSRLRGAGPVISAMAGLSGGRWAVSMLGMSQVLMQSWRLATEVIRRHPGRRPIETYPGGALDDRLTLIKQPGVRAHINRNGSIHASGPSDGTGPPHEAMVGSDADTAALLAQPPSPAR